MIFLKHHKWHAKVRIPKALQESYGGKQFLQVSLGTSDKREAAAKADVWLGTLRLEWQGKSAQRPVELTPLRDIYAVTRRVATAGGYTADVDGADPMLAGVDLEIDRMAEAIGERDLLPAEEFRLMALQDAKAELVGLPVEQRPQLELPFSEVATAFIAQWRTKKELKESNTEQQKKATFKLFGGFWRDKPLRGIRETDVARFHDLLRHLRPEWARSAKARALSWSDLLHTYSDPSQSLSDATMNRHMQTLQALWKWAKRRGHCAGDNPFEGFSQRLSLGKNVNTYRAWENDELNRLLVPPPRRQDLREVILVGMFTGMRLDEIASLTWDRIRTDEGVPYFQIDDAKTPAGVRQVPLHTALAWLYARKGGKTDGRVWPTFNEEGPAKKAGADASREFSRFKQSRGFKDRTKVFHSFRKNVTRQMERAGVPEGEWAQVFGHERGFTYGRYNLDGITLARKAEIIGLISYSALAPEALLVR